MGKTRKNQGLYRLYVVTETVPNTQFTKGRFVKASMKKSRVAYLERLSPEKQKENEYGQEYSEYVAIPRIKRLSRDPRFKYVKEVTLEEYWKDYSR